MTTASYRRLGAGRAAACALVWIAGCAASDDGHAASLDPCDRCDVPVVDAGRDAQVDAGRCANRPRPAPRLAFEQVALPDKPQQATSFAFAPDGDELLVTLKSGVIGRYRNAADGFEKLGEFELPELWSNNDCGLLTIAFDPDFRHNRFVYAAGCIAQTANRIWRVTLDADGDDAATTASAVEILTVSEPKAPRPFHNAGTLEFDADGHLWATFGDKVRSNNGQDLSDDLGGVLRIDPSRDPDEGGSTPTPGNPFEFQDDASPNVYAYGLRYPFRGSFDRKGRFWIGDVGAEKFEEIDVVTAPGQNFGWDNKEGPCGPACDDFVEPIVSWPHDPDNRYAADDDDVAPTESTSVWVGVTYEDRGNDRYAGLMTDRLLFGDFCPGWMRVLEVDDDLNVVVDAFAGHLETAVQWRQGPDGYLYVLTFGTCGSVVKKPPESKLYRAVLESPCSD